MALWYILYRRRQQTSKTSPIMSSKGRDLEQQLSMHIDKESPRSNHSSRDSAHSRTSSDQSTRRSSLKPQHRRQRSTPPLLSSLPTVPSPPSRPVSTKSTSSTTAANSIAAAKAAAESRRKSAVLSAIENQPTNIHIDMLDVDDERLLPIIISEEIAPPPEQRLSLVQECQQQEQPKNQTQEQNQQQCVTTNIKQGNITSNPALTTDSTPFMTNAPIMSTSTPRRQSLAPRKSSESVSSTRSSISLLPPPPPPNVPPPAIPLTSAAGLSDSTRTRVSTESMSSAVSSTPKRSIPSSSSTTGSRIPKGIILPPSTPPPTPGFPASPSKVKYSGQTQQTSIPVHLRRHQKSPSQILSTGYLASSERSPLSPPLSPLTIQIPRNTSPARSSLAFSGNNAAQVYHPAYARPDSPTTGYNNPAVSQLSSSAPTNKSAKAAHMQMQHSRKVRSKSISSSNEATHRIMIPPPALSGPRSPLTIKSAQGATPPIPIPTRLADHLPPSPSAHSPLSYLRRPSLTYQQASNSWEGASAFSSRASSATPNSAVGGRTTPGGSPLSREEEERELQLHLQHLQRQSMSLDYWTNLQPTLEESEDSMIRSDSRLSIATDSSLDVQTIISDALAIAAAKTTAIEMARQSTWYRQQALQQMHRQSQYGTGNGSMSRPWTPSEEQWGSTAPTSTSSSRSQSPFYPAAPTTTQA
ncbi:hypothetical protein BGZ99_000011 [Dissophora globulifera]|uniref:Uncharacterized protein n=1 Tax=Dissophora globulifera TaxID=979702 RepID=A0A9P6RZQ1_9FUNG|nr:hypothetical protein BGZ99_000011 [Dissophora globulifera]